MKIKIEINTDNAAFYNSEGEYTPDFEVRRILLELTNKLLNASNEGMEIKKINLVDSNGNIVGAYQTQISRTRK